MCAVLYQVQTSSPVLAVQEYELPVVQVSETEKPPVIHSSGLIDALKPMVYDVDSLSPTVQEEAGPQSMFSYQTGQSSY